MLMRFDPFRELDRVTAELWGNEGRRASSLMAMDAFRDGDQFVVHFDLPGVDPESIDVTLEDNVLTVTGQRESNHGDSHEFVARERYQGALSRQVILGDRLDAENISAGYDAGVLTLTVPVAEQAKPRKISVSAGTREAIDATSTAA